MKKLLIVTTVSDLSLPLFLTQDVSMYIDVDVLFLHENINVFKEYCTSYSYDFVYIRDPFNDELLLEDIHKKIDTIFDKLSKSYFVDNLKSFQDICFEDKYVQYQQYKEFMPYTKILENIGEIDTEDTITKKRISSRARDIIFSSTDFTGNNLSEYIIQDNIAICQEYRVYIIFDKIMEIVSLKSSKSKISKVKVVGTQKISSELKAYTQLIMKHNKFEFIGLDIAKSDDKFYLIEANRSCLFGSYFKNTHINLASIFVQQLLARTIHYSS